jgi:hypothetical protein
VKDIKAIARILDVALGPNPSAGQFLFGGPHPDLVFHQIRLGDLYLIVALQLHTIEIPSLSQGIGVLK